jgi:hypothetical protein
MGSRIIGEGGRSDSPNVYVVDEVGGRHASSAMAKEIHSHAHEEVIPGTVNLKAVEGDDTYSGQAVFPVPSSPFSPLNNRPAVLTERRETSLRTHLLLQVIYST